MRRLAEQREGEARLQARVNRAMHEDPSPPVDDPLRAHYQAQQAMRGRTWAKAPTRSGCRTNAPYDPRHSFASLL